MENRTRFDITTLVAILVAGASLLGLCLILFISRISPPVAPALQTDTSTPFKYLLLGTEPGISTAEPPAATEAPTELEPSVEAGTSVPETDTATHPVFAVTSHAGSLSEGTPSSGGSTPRKTFSPPTLRPTVATDDPFLIFKPGTKTATPPIIVIEISPTLTFTPGGTLTNTPTRTPRPTATQGNTLTPTNTLTPSLTALPGSLPPGKYDDFESRITYIGSWVTQTGVSGAYQTTLHVSNTAGNALTFSFTGKALRLSYQGGPSLGTVIIVLDGRQFQLQQDIGNEWVSDSLPNGTHTVAITHISLPGAVGSVNIDSITIEPLATPTP